MQQKIDSTRHFKAGYDIHYGSMSIDGEEWTPLRWATTPNGVYIGDPVHAHRLCQQRGIRPEVRTGQEEICSIGFCEREQKWYGWSHRAMYGFGIGDVVSEGDCTASSGWIDGITPDGNPDPDVLEVGFTAKTLEDAKLMACAFASSVG